MHMDCDECGARIHVLKNALYANPCAWIRLVSLFLSLPWLQPDSICVFNLRTHRRVVILEQPCRRLNTEIGEWLVQQSSAENGRNAEKKVQKEITKFKIEMRKFSTCIHIRVQRATPNLHTNFQRSTSRLHWTAHGARFHFSVAVAKREKLSSAIASVWESI